MIRFMTRLGGLDGLEPSNDLNGSKGMVRVKAAVEGSLGSQKGWWEKRQLAAAL